MHGVVVRIQSTNDGRYREVAVKFGMCTAEAAKALAGLARECETAPDRVMLYVRSE